LPQAILPMNPVQGEHAHGIPVVSSSSPPPRSPDLLALQVTGTATLPSATAPLVALVCCKTEEEEEGHLRFRTLSFSAILRFPLCLIDLAENPLDLLGSLHPDPIRGFLQI
jgi:hypothetical protein